MRCADICETLFFFSDKNVWFYKHLYIRRIVYMFDKISDCLINNLHIVWPTGPPNAETLPEDGKLKSETMVKDNRRYYLDLKENSRGRFLRVSFPVFIATQNITILKVYFWGQVILDIFCLPKLLSNYFHKKFLGWFMNTREIPAFGGISLALRGSGALGATFGEPPPSAAVK